MPFASDQLDVLIDAAAVSARVAELGRAITQDYGSLGPSLTLVGIMKGSLFFLADLARAIDLPLTVELMGVSSYRGGTETTGEVRITHDLTQPIHGRHVLLVEDIIDSGRTLHYICEVLNAREPASLKICTLLDKYERREVDVPLDYVGFHIPNEFVFGYGLDLDELYRNLPFIGVVRD